LIDAGAQGVIYTREALQILLTANRAKPFLPDELCKLHALKRTFKAKLIGEQTSRGKRATSLQTDFGRGPFSPPNPKLVGKTPNVQIVHDESVTGTRRNRRRTNRRVILM
jgi:hypothetical protein